MGYRAVASDASSNTATFVPAEGVTLPDGNFRATLMPEDILDSAGNLMATPGMLDFFVLRRDADHDRTVGPAASASPRSIGSFRSCKPLL